MPLHWEHAIPIALAGRISGQITYAILRELLTSCQAPLSVRELSPGLGKYLPSQLLS
jgi:hypothetical protein